MDIPIGTILAYAGPNVDEETAKQWMLCDGRSLDKTKYKELYKVISQSFGAGYDESGNKIQGDFNIPDLRGRFLRGVSEDLKYDPDFDSREPMRKGGNPGGNVGSIQPARLNYQLILL